MKIALSIAFGLNVLLCNVFIARAAAVPADRPAMEAAMAAMQTMGHGCPGHGSSDAPPMPTHGEHCFLMPTVNLYSSLPRSAAASLPVSQHLTFVLAMTSALPAIPAPAEWPPPFDLPIGTVVLRQ